MVSDRNRTYQAQETVRDEQIAQALFPAALLEGFTHRLVYGFTGKPFSLGGPDTPGNEAQQVRENRRRFLDYHQIGHLSWISPEQVHGHRIGRTGDCHFKQTDGVLVLHPNYPVLLKFADCVPIILYDPEHHAGAVLHAGWRGTEQRIAMEGVVALQNAVGTNPEKLIAVIGPSIAVCCFQISREIAHKLAQAMSSDVDTLEQQGRLQWDEAFPDNPRVDLKALNADQLASVGVQKLEILEHCTRCLTDRLYSYRRGEDGRNAAYLMLHS